MNYEPQDLGKQTPIETGIVSFVEALKNCINPYFKAS